MQITEILDRIGGVQSMARELGVSESDAAGGVAALLPAILGGFKKQAQAQPMGLDGLGGLLTQLGGGGLLEEVLAPRPTNVTQGNDILGQIFGSKDVSRTVAQSAASRSGLDPALLKKMLPIVAMLVAGYMAKKRSGQLGSLLGGLFPTQTASAAPAASALGLAAMLDMDGDGNPLDDILGMAGRALR
jgi:hypothetical protein